MRRSTIGRKRQTPPTAAAFGLGFERQASDHPSSRGAGLDKTRSPRVAADQRLIATHKTAVCIEASTASSCDSWAVLSA